SLAIAAGLIAAQVAEPSQAYADSIAGSLPAGGVGLIVWGGGSIESLTSAADQQGCSVRAAWTTSGGDFASYIPGAPDVANQPFFDAFPGGTIPAGAALIVDCRAGAPASEPTAPAPLSFEEQARAAVF